jgi:hypothetical protein
VYQALEYEFGIVGAATAPHNSFKALAAYSPTAQYTFKSLQQGEAVLYVCVALAGTARSGTATGSGVQVCEMKPVVIKAPESAIDIVSVAASVNVSMLERSGDLGSLADAARLLSSLAAYASSTSTGTSSNVSTAGGDLQSAVQKPAADLVMSASRMVNRDSPAQMHQVRVFKRCLQGTWLTNIQLSQATQATAKGCQVEMCKHTIRLN